jgi:3-isopropylmalate dehydrogenase
LLRYSLGLEKEAKLVEDAVRKALDGGARTADLGRGSMSTSAMGDAVIKALDSLTK